MVKTDTLQLVLCDPLITLNASLDNRRNNQLPMSVEPKGEDDNCSVRTRLLPLPTIERTPFTLFPTFLFFTKLYL